MMDKSWKSYFITLLILSTFASVLGSWKSFDTGVCYAKKMGTIPECSKMVLWEAEFIFSPEHKPTPFDNL